MSQENVERMRRAFRRFQSGDPGWIDTLDRGIEWDVSAHPLPDVPNRGHGREQLLSRVLATYFKGWIDYRSEIDETIDAGDDVILVLHETARLRDSGMEFERDLIRYGRCERDARSSFESSRPRPPRSRPSGWGGQAARRSGSAIRAVG